MSASVTPGPSAPHAPVPPARRVRGSSWRDPRLVVGVAIVAASVLLGARLLGGADDMVAVWAVRTDLPGGTTVRAGDLVERRVRFASPADADRYLSAEAALPDRATLNRPVGAGEMLPRAALEVGGAEPMAEVPLAVPTQAVPATVRPGSVVDVWVTPEQGAGRRGESVLVFDDVPVVAAPETGAALGPSTTRQIIVGIDASRQGSLPAALARAAGGTILITTQG